MDIIQWPYWNYSFFVGRCNEFWFYAVLRCITPYSVVLRNAITSERLNLETSVVLHMGPIACGYRMDM